MNDGLTGVKLSLMLAHGMTSVWVRLYKLKVSPSEARGAALHVESIS